MARTIRSLSVSVRAVAKELENVKAKAPEVKQALREVKEEAVQMAGGLRRVWDAADMFGDQMASEGFAVNAKYDSEGRQIAGEKSGGFITAETARQWIELFDRLMRITETHRLPDGKQANAFHINEALRSAQNIERFFRDIFPQFGNITDRRRELEQYMAAVAEEKRRKEEERAARRAPTTSRPVADEEEEAVDPVTRAAIAAGFPRGNRGATSTPPGLVNRPVPVSLPKAESDKLDRADKRSEETRKITQEIAKDTTTVDRRTIKIDQSTLAIERKLDELLRLIRDWLKKTPTPSQQSTTRTTSFEDKPAPGVT